MIIALEMSVITPTSDSKAGTFPILAALNPALSTLPTYQPGRPIEEVAREHNLPVETIIKVASNENPLGPSPKAVAAMRDVLDELKDVANRKLRTSCRP